MKFARKLVTQMRTHGALPTLSSKRSTQPQRQPLSLRPASALLQRRQPSPRQNVITLTSAATALGLAVSEQVSQPPQQPQRPQQPPQTQQPPPEPSQHQLPPSSHAPPAAQPRADDGGSTSGNDGRLGGGSLGLGFGVSLSGDEVLRGLGTTGLTEYERAEIRDVGTVYWAGETASKPRATLLPGEHNHGYDDEEGRAALHATAQHFAPSLPHRYDDERGDYHVTLHDHLNYRYEVLGVVGRGAFGQVLRAFDHQMQRPVAIKVIRNKARFHKQALVEAKVR